MKLSPAWFLFLVAPMTAEYVSGSSPYLNPFVWVANFLLYGCGTLLIRELRARWGKGWLGVFLLGAAYMIAEEGLMLNTLFDPDKNTAGRAMGVNWVWTAGMLVVHTLVSIVTPIMLAESLYAKVAGESWLGRRAAWALFLAFLADVFGLGRLIAPYHRPPLGYDAAEFGLIVLCVFLARSIRIPAPKIVPRSPARMFAVSSVGMLATMLVNFAAPTISMPAAAKIAVMLFAYGAFLFALYRAGAFQPALSALGKFAVASGLISFWVVFSPLGSVAKHSPGPVLFGAAMAIFLWRQRRRLIQSTPAIPWAGGQTAG